MESSLSANTSAPPQTRTILIVDDQPLILTVVRRSLERAGFNVLSASSGKQAFETCDDHKEPIHLMISDVVMPGMNGQQVARLLRDYHAEMRILFISAHPENHVAERGLIRPGDAFLQKPFTRQQLVEKVQAVLDGPHPALPDSLPHV